ncbi:MAG: VWA domain-containing protein [bacterium]
MRPLVALRRMQRRPQGFNLAFLDIMACGLGAIILVFMLVKYHTAESGAGESGEGLRAEAAELRAEAARIESRNRALATQIETLKEQLRSRITRSARAQSEGEAAAKELTDLTAEIAALEARLAQAKTQASAQSSDSPRADRPKQDHLIGLRVKGARILILLDSSASMADERLVDIIKIKSSGVAVKQAAPKWRRARAVADWIIERVPDDSRYMLMHYNAKPEFVPSERWLDGDDDDARTNLTRALDALHPHGATNLHAALSLIASSAIRPTDIYVITDGLPTTGRLSVLQKLKECRALSKSNTVSGACRLALFYAAIESFTDRAATVNAVLLPIEGDPDAAYAYWLWASSTTGLMISPAESWP